MSSIYSELQEDINENEKKPIFILCKKNVSLDSIISSIIYSNEKSVLRMGTPVDPLVKNYGFSFKINKMNIEWDNKDENIKEMNE